jgi:hypothetical protein
VTGMPLHEMLDEVRKELLKSHIFSTGAEVRFEAEKVEMEVQVCASAEVKAEVGAKVWVLDAGAGARVAEQAVHKLHLSLKPILHGGGKLEVAGTAPEKPALG